MFASAPVYVPIAVTFADYFGRIGGFRALLILISFGLADCNLLMVFFADTAFGFGARDKVDSVPFLLFSFSKGPLSMLIRFMKASLRKSLDLIESGFALVTLLVEADASF